LEIKTSTVNGATYDLSRTLGNLLIGFTDLVNNKVNGHSFSVVTESSTTTFGVLGDLGNNNHYHLVPGTIKLADLPVDPFQIPITQNMILFCGIIRFTGTLGAGVSITMTIVKNGVDTPYVLQMTSTSGGTVVNQLTSVDFTYQHTYEVRINTVGNPGTGTFTATLGFY
jgi:hypothetical protein